MSTTMRALTLWRPWPYAILHLPGGLAKRVENRPWRPWPSIIGQRIALHAGKNFDIETQTTLLSLMDEHDMLADNVVHERMTAEGIVGTAIVEGWVYRDDRRILWSHALPESEAHEALRSPWFFGPYGWVIEDVRTLAEPIPCKGAQGLWLVPDDVRARIELQEAA